MPRESHIERQVYWKSTLQKYGCNVNLEKTIHIRGAPVIVDVFAEIDGKEFLIEIGNIADKRKNALMQFHAEKNPKIEFIHESYGENKIQSVLESVSSYRETPEYKRLIDNQGKIAEIQESQIVFNFGWTFLCIVGFFSCIFISSLETSLLFLVGVAVLMPFIWFFGIIVGNRSYNFKKKKFEELSF